MHLNDLNPDEAEYERAHANESQPDLLETKQRFFWNTNEFMELERSIEWSVSIAVTCDVSSTIFLVCATICMIGNTSTELVTDSTPTS